MERPQLSLRPTDVTGSVASVSKEYGGAAFAALLSFAMSTCVVLACVMLAWAVAFPAAALEKQPLTFATSSGSHAITVEVADTESTRSTGLMYRRSIGADEGMIFIYDREQEITMWMKNTYISLDMIFVKRDGTISHIAANAEPFSENIISSEGPALAVIEMAAGSAARLGLRPGDKVRHPAFK
jgi:uncharacterized membrane protein (UPF0127 family)